MVTDVFPISNAPTKRRRKVWFNIVFASESSVQYESQLLFKILNIFEINFVFIYIV